MTGLFLTLSVFIFYVKKQAPLSGQLVFQEHRIAGSIFKPIFYEQTVFLDEERCSILVMYEGAGS